MPAERPYPVGLVMGVRPHFIKAAAMQSAWSRMGDARPPVDPVFVNIGQHYDDELAGVYFRELAVNVDVDLTHRHQSHDTDQIVLHSIDLLMHIARERGLRGLVVFGDANAALVGAVAARLLGLPLAHIEAGLRRGDRSTAEEINTCIADQVASLHLAASHVDVLNLENEGFADSTYFVGDVVRDLVAELCDAGLVNVDRHVNSNAPVVATFHRAESMNAETLWAFSKLLAATERPVDLYAHPRLVAELKNYCIQLPDNVTVSKPIAYVPMLQAIADAYYVITDSGALQREAFYLGRRALVAQRIPFWRSLTNAGYHLTIDLGAGDVDAAPQRMRELLLDPAPAVDDFGERGVCRKVWYRLGEWIEGFV